MSVCTFIAADCPLPERKPSQEYPLCVNVDEGTIYDGDADDNFFLSRFDDVSGYTEKAYGVYLQWHYTEGRAWQVIKYIKAALCHTDSVELWHIWLDVYLDVYEWEERPMIRTAEVSIADLAPEDLLELEHQEIWNASPRFKDRPTFYCLRIIR